jgi:drug/metabolite transporter (DMT)-like permease
VFRSLHPLESRAIAREKKTVSAMMRLSHPWLALAHFWKERSGRVILAFALVYVFWGSTYLGIRVAVERVPPILLAGVRFSVAGSLMLAFCALTGRRVAVTRRQFAQLATIGFILLGVANAALAWSELYVPTGLAALIVAIVPIWFLLIERFILPTGDRVTASAVGGVALGALGVVVLFWPKVSGGHTLGWMQLVACVGLLGSSFCWAFGSVLSRRWKVPVDPLAASAWQMLTAGVIDTSVGLALGDQHRATWNGASVGAIAYLVVFGSWVGYSAYIWLLRHIPTAKVATYAYVNPIVAVLLGWLFLGESIDRYILAGAAIIVPAVALATRSESPGDDAAPVAEAG